MSDHVYLKVLLNLLIADAPFNLLGQPLAHFEYVTFRLPFVGPRHQIIRFGIELLHQVLDVKHIVGTALESMAQHIEHILILNWRLRWLKLTYLVEQHGLLTSLRKAVDVLQVLLFVGILRFADFLGNRSFLPT